MKNIFTICAKELKSLFTSMAAYVVLAVFVATWEYLFFRNAFLVGEASLRNLYDLLPWLTLIVVPAVTMGAIVREREEGTLELILTRPVKEIELIAGKWLAVTVYVTSGLLFAIPVALGFAAYGQFDWGVFGGQLLASIALVAGMSALGVWVSAVSTTAIAAMLVSATLGFVGIMIGTDFVGQSLPIEVSGVLSRLSIATHMSAMSRGVLDVRDIWYFVSIIAIFLGLTYLELIKRKYGNVKKRYLSTQTGMYLVVAIIVVTNVLGDRIGGRLDLTASRQFTLSPVTREMLVKLPDVVTITLFASAKLPAQYSPVLRDVRDMLRDYQALGHSNLVVVYKNPSGDPSVASEATTRGVREVQFNVIGQEELQLKTGFLGLAIDYAGRSEVLPFIAQTGDLEYQLTSAIAKLTTRERKKIVVLAGEGQKDLYSELSVINTELVKQFDVTTQNATDAAALIIPGTGPVITEDNQKIIDDFVTTKRPILLLADTYDVSPQALSANPNDTKINDWLKKYGVTVNANLIYDLRANETVRLGSAEVSYLLPYPFWARAQTPDGLTTVMPWASSLTVEDEVVTEAGYGVQKLMLTSSFAGAKTGAISISPDQATFPEEGLAQQILGIVLTPTNAGSKIIVIGDSDWMTDQFVQGGQNDNLSLGLGLVSQLAGGQNLGEISAKQNTSGPLMFTSGLDAVIVKFGNLGLAVVLPMLAGGLVMWRRKKAQSRTYAIAK